MDDPYNLQRFVAAQNEIYDQVRAELREGYKIGHWMWFIFPQIDGLGHSATAKHFAISSLAEAQAYLRHSSLGPRLIECTGLVKAVTERTANQIFGYPDDLKLRSSMTLFAYAAPDQPLFREVLGKYFNGAEDLLTQERL
ncbi:MAG: DUF1810 domain-containing protein [Pseudonocardiaceae bacterium]